MGKPLPQVDAAIDLSEPYRLLLAGHGGVIVTEHGKPVGFLARIDLVEFWTERRRPRAAVAGIVSH
jgi:cystathionine beta-synthase